MSIDLDVKANGLAEALKLVEAIKERARNLEPVLKGRAEALRGSIIGDSFGGSQDMQGNAWEPLSDATLLKRRGGSAQILVDTGQLRGSIETKATQGSILFGVSGAATRYAGAHLFGTRTIPRRAFLPVDTSGDPLFESGPALRWYDRMQQRVLDYIVEGKL